MNFLIVFRLYFITKFILNHTVWIDDQNRKSWSNFQYFYFA